VGPKLAQRVILELKSKAPAVMAMGASLHATATADEDVIETAPAPAAKRPAKPAAPSAAQTRAAASADALSALANLGYGPADAAQAVATVAADQPEADAATMIRAALKLLAPKA
jgi:Holliday junction DNA helicase RuvA